MSKPFDKGSDIAKRYASQIKDKVILITGVTPKSLGAQYVLTLAQYQPSLLILAGRNKGRLEETASSLPKEVPYRLLDLDLSSQQKVKDAAKEVQNYKESIDLLVNNAGIMAVPYSKTTDGIEMQFGCNHIGHFLFTNLILNKLSSSARIINVSSDGYRLHPIRFEDYNFQDGKVYDEWRSYGQTKTANMLFSVELNKRLKAQGSKMTTFSLHPGAIKTNLSNHLDQENFNQLMQMDSQDGWMASSKGFRYKDLDEGVATHIYASFDPDIVKDSGAFLQDCHVMKPEEVLCWGRDEVDAQKLWKLSEELVDQTF